MPGGGAWPDLAIDGPRTVGGAEDAAVIVAVEDYAGLADRPGADAVAAAWYRHFRVARGLAPRRIHLLRGADATPRAITRAIEAARRGARDGALWFVFIGHIASPRPGEYGDLLLAGSDATDATRGAHAYPIPAALGRLAYGRHTDAIVVLDGCLASAGAGRSGTWTPAPPPFRTRGGEPGYDVSRRRREPSDVAIFAAGLGGGCVEDLPGVRFPALSYLVLGGLRGWADRNGDRNIRAVEVIGRAALVLRAAVTTGTRPQPSLYGADLLLARRVGEPAPPLAAVRPPTAAPVDERAALAEPVAWTSDPAVVIDRGDYTMGCPRAADRDCEADERPAHRVRLSRFRIDRREVTNGEYQACVDARACKPIDRARCFVWTGRAFVRGAPLPEPLTRPDHPVTCVDWHSAANYCAVLGRRLPTEAEWERTAVGLVLRRYPWGQAEPTCAHAQHDGCGEHTRPVGSRPKGDTPEGVQDLAGNAAEWVADWYDRHGYGGLFAPRDPTGPSYGRVRVVRGGSFYDAAVNLRAAYRYGLSPGAGFSTVGFRCAL